MINAHEVVPNCQHALCTTPLYTGKCSDECLKRYRKEFGHRTEAKWKTRAEYNDFLWVECSNCGFRVENYKAVKQTKSNRECDEAIYKFCPICGKSMGV